MKKYPRQSVLTGYTGYTSLIYNKKEYNLVKVFFLKVDYEKSHTSIFVIIDDKYPELVNRIISTCNDSVFHGSCIKVNNISEKISNIRIGEYKGNTVYKIPKALLDFICVYVVDGKLRFYDMLDCKFDEEVYDLYKTPKYKLLTKDKFITKDEAYNFLEQLIGEYKIEGSK